MTTSPDTESEKPVREFTLLKLFVKDLSFESPRPVDALIGSDYRPDVDFQLHTETRRVEEGLFEVSLTVTVSAVQRESGETLYLAEVNQAGLFAMQGLTELDYQEALYQHCPDVLFPYAREAVSHLVQRGGFPQLLLKPVNFGMLYEEYIEADMLRAGGEAG